MTSKLKHPELVTFCKEKIKHLQKTNKMKLWLIRLPFKNKFYRSVFCSQFSVKDPRHETLLVTTRSAAKYLLKHHQTHLCTGHRKPFIQAAGKSQKPLCQWAIPSDA